MLWAQTLALPQLGSLTLWRRTGSIPFRKERCRLSYVSFQVVQVIRLVSSDLCTDNSLWYSDQSSWVTHRKKKHTHILLTALWKLNFSLSWKVGGAQLLRKNDQLSSKLHNKRNEKERKKKRERAKKKRERTMYQSIVSRGDWLWKSASIKVENICWKLPDREQSFGFCSQTWQNWPKLVSRFKMLRMLLNVVHSTVQKHTTRKSNGFYNYSTLITMIKDRSKFAKKKNKQQ